MKKKLTAVALVVCMLAIMLVGASLAYFTDKDEATNTFTVGNVDIELIESCVHRGADTAYENIPGYPEATGGEHTNAQVLSGSDYDGSTNYDDYLKAQTIMPGIGINKMPYVLNTGVSEAYIRIRVMIPAAMNTAHLDSSVICTTALTSGEFKRPAGVSDYAVDGQKTVNDVEYDVYTFIRNEPLASQEMTYWNVWNQIKMDTDVTMDDLNQMIADKVITEDGQFNVLVQADAIQAASFADVDAAWVAFDAEVNK